MIVSLSNGFIFFKPPKVAGSSIECAISSACNENDLMTGPDPDDIERELVPDYYRSQNNTDPANGLDRFHTHTDPEMFFNLTGSTWDRYFIISCARNPWDLCVSYYWWVLEQLFYKNGKDPSKCVWQHSDSTGSDLPALIFNNDKPETIHEKFKGFLLSDWIDNNDGSFENCIDFISGQSCKFIHDSVNYYIRFENLQEDMDNLSKVLAKDFDKVPRFKSHQRDRTLHYRDFYSQETYNLVLKKFSKIITNFRYTF